MIVAFVVVIIVVDVRLLLQISLIWTIRHGKIVQGKVIVSESKLNDAMNPIPYTRTKLFHKVWGASGWIG